MKEIHNTSEAKKGNKILVKEIETMWNSHKREYYDVCFEYVFEIIRNNSTTLSCKYLNGPFKGSSFNWEKGYDLIKNQGKKYFVLENDSEIIDRNYSVTDRKDIPK